MSLQDSIIRRLQRLPISVSDLQVEGHLHLLRDSEERGRPDYHLYEALDRAVGERETSVIVSPFLEADLSAQLDDGDVLIGYMSNGTAVRISFGNA